MKQAAPARSPTPPSNGSILNGRRGGGAGRGGNQRHRNQNSRSASSPISNPATASTAQHTIRIAPSGNRHHAASPISAAGIVRSEEHTSELQSLMRISYAVFCLKKNTQKPHTQTKNKLSVQNI